MGIAGAFRQKLNIGDTIIATDVYHHDVSIRRLSEHYPNIPNVQMHTDKDFLNCAEKVKKQLSVEILLGKLLKD